jgi:pimeloyl-ACP methyl ester carboxylesterase
VPREIEHLSIEANGQRFHVAARAADRDGAPELLFIHGFPEGWMVWRAVMERLEDCSCYAVDMRGYPGSPSTGPFDVWTLTDDIRALIDALGLRRPLLVGDDWGAALVWIFGHRFSDAVRHLVAVNAPHPATLVRAVLHFDHLQGLRIPWVPFYEIPRVPEWFMTTPPGRRLMRWAILIREARKGAMDRAVVDEVLAQYRAPRDWRGPVGWYRTMVAMQLSSAGRARLKATYEPPITAPVTLVWGEEDGALSTAVARKSHRDAKCPVEWRPLHGVGHFVALEAPDALAAEVRRLVGP